MTVHPDALHVLQTQNLFLLIFINLTGKGKGERAVSLTQDRGSDVWEVGSYLFRLLVRGREHTGGIETSLSLRARAGGSDRSPI